MELSAGDQREPEHSKNLNRSVDSQIANTSGRFGTLAALNGSEISRPLDELSEASVYSILNSLKPNGEGVVCIPANIKIELEQAGMVESLTDQEHNRRSARVDTIPAVVESLQLKEQALNDLQKTVDDLNGKLNSSWHKFWSFGWLGSDKLTREQDQLDKATARLPTAREAYQSAQTLNLELSEIQSHLSKFVRTTQGFLALSAAGSSYMQQIEMASFERLLEVATPIRAEASKLDGRYSHDSSARYMVAATLAGGDSTKLSNAYRLASELDGNYSRVSHATILIACILAGSESAARDAYRIARQLDGNYSHDSLARYMVAAALAGGDSTRISSAYRLASELDGNYSHKSHATYLIACILAGSDNAARDAHRSAGRLEGNYSHDSHARYMVAAALANGDSLKLASAVRVASKLDGNYSRDSHATTLIACILAQGAMEHLRVSDQ